MEIGNSSQSYKESCRVSNQIGSESASQFALQVPCSNKPGRAGPWPNWRAWKQVGEYQSNS